MLDLLVFSLAAAAARCIGRRNPLLATPSPPGAAGDGGDARRRRLRRAASRCVFHGALLLSLLLFSLSTLEAAPPSWLVVIEGPPSLVAWYRALLWALGALLSVAVPSIGGAMVGASVLPGGAAAAASSGGALTPPSPRRRASLSEGGRTSRSGRRPLIIICRNVLWIGVRFLRFLVVTIAWRLLRRAVGAMIPYRITRVDRRGGAGNNLKKLRCCSTGIVVSAFISLCLSLFSLATVGSLVLKFDVDDGGNACATSVLTWMVSVLCAFGMIVASILNGFGCASLPHANLVGVFLEPTPPSTITKVEEDFHYAVKTLEEKRWMLADEMKSSSSSSFTPSKTKASSEKQRTKQLREEIVFLRALVGDMKDDIDEMKQSQRLAMAARTTAGRVRGALGYAFSVVLVVRVLLAAGSFVPVARGGDDAPGAGSRRDPLTSVALWLLGRNVVRTQEQYDLFRQGTSLVLAAGLGASQVRTFFRVAGALGRRLGRARCVGAALEGGMPPDDAGGRRASGNDGALLLASFVMGCYFLACVTVAKMTLPEEYRSSFAEAVGLNFRFNTRFLNMIFFGSACVSAVTLASLFGIQRNNSERYQLESQLSSLSSQLA